MAELLDHYLPNGSTQLMLLNCNKRVPIYVAYYLCQIVQTVRYKSLRHHLIEGPEGPKE